MSITWVDDVTPLDAVNMNKLEQVARKGAASGYVGLDASNNASIGGALLAGSTLYANQGTANQVIAGYNGSILAAGFAFGPGAGGDTNLFRSAAGNLRTDGTFTVGGGIITGSNLDLRGDVDVYVSSQTAAGVICFRNLANATALFVMPDGKLAFSYGQDTNLYRSAAGVLRTDSRLWVGGEILSKYGAAEQITLGDDGKLYFGNAYDTNLWRVAAGILKTDGILWIGGSQLAFTTDTGKFYFGAASDVNLYRSAADILKTDDTLVVVGGLQMDAGGNGYALQFGNAGDAMISRVAAGVLQMANQFQLQFPATGTAYKKLDLGAADSGGAGFRMVRVPN